MKPTRGWMLAVGLMGVMGVTGVMGATACGDPHNLPTFDAAPDVSTYDPVARGQYIMNVTAACTFCHSPLLPNGTRDPAKLLSGVDCFVDLDNPPSFTDNNDGIGCLSTRNLTNHETGLKLRTDEQIKNAFRNGRRTDGKFLVPVMPYYIFHNMTDQDADAVVAYLRTVPGVDHTVKPNEIPFSTYNDGDFVGSGFNYVPYLKDTEIPAPGAGAGPGAQNGRYLVSKIGLCVDCHTPEKTPFGITLDMTKAFAGGKIFTKGQLGLVDTANTYPNFIITRNLTPDATGLMGWSKDQIKKAVAEGRDQNNMQVCAATHGGAISPYAALEPQDLDDIADYIHSLAPVVNDTIHAQCWASSPVALPPTVGTAETNCAVTGNNTVDDDDLDGVPNDGCGESGADCFNFADDDGDGQADDGCYLPCGNCEGPQVP